MGLKEGGSGRKRTASGNKSGGEAKWINKKLPHPQK